MEPIYESVTQISIKYGLPRQQILEYCNARGQKFAFKGKSRNSKFRINSKAFHEFLERKRKGIA